MAEPPVDAPMPPNGHVHGVSLSRFDWPRFPMNWYLFRDKAAIRLHLRTCTVLLLAIIGTKLVVDGSYALDLETVGMGVLVLYGAYRLLLRWFGD
jgi:hypothetical protein